MAWWPDKPWWELAVYILGALGGTKAVIWDWILSPLRQRAKILGSVDKVVVRPLGVAWAPSIIEDTVTTAFDTEICLHVFSYNKHTQHTYLKKWLLLVEIEGREPLKIESIPHTELRNGLHVGPFLQWMPEDVRFFWKEPNKGWLFFYCPNTESKVLESAKLKLFAVDVEGRKHKIRIE